MTVTEQAGRSRILLLALLAVLLLVPEATLAYPADPPPRDEVRERSEETLLARRPRRRRTRGRRARPRPRRRPKPAAKPKPAPAAQPSTDVENQSTSASGGQVDPGALRRGGRVEFDGRLVQGQTAKSGAIYLFARKRTELKSMVGERTTYRDEVLRTVYPSWSKQKQGQAR